MSQPQPVPPCHAAAHAAAGVLAFSRAWLDCMACGSATWPGWETAGRPKQLHLIYGVHLGPERHWTAAHAGISVTRYGGIAPSCLLFSGSHPMLGVHRDRLTLQSQRQLYCWRLDGYSSVISFWQAWKADRHDTVPIWCAGLILPLAEFPRGARAFESFQKAINDDQTMFRTWFLASFRMLGGQIISKCPSIRIPSHRFQ